MTDLQLALRNRPPGRAVMFQSWRDLLFLHFPCDPAEVAALLPPGLSVDTFPDEHGVEKAWIGFVPFLMTNVRWANAPAIPGTHTFPETNIRTYVHRDGQEPGVWFFSLDAMNRLAVMTARRAFSLPYFFAQMGLGREEKRVSYCGRRSGASYEIEALLGDKIDPLEPGSLEFFLVERYLLYAFRGGRLWTGRVHHAPYSLCTAKPLKIKESLVAAAGISPQEFIHAVFAPGVDVEIFPLRRT